MKFVEGAWAAIALLLLSGGVSAADAPLCSRDVMCVIAVENGDRVDVYVDNRQSAEITVTLDSAPKNMAADVVLPHTATFPGAQMTRAFSMTRADRSRPSDYRLSFAWTWGNLNAVHNDAHVYRLPYAPGRFHRVDQGFNGPFSHFGDFQYSIDFAMPMGTPIHAARGGVVVGVKDIYDAGGPSREYENQCNYVMIKHDDGTIAEYDHLLKGGVKVKVGDRVGAGDFIALSGNSGFTTGPHLHFFVYKATDGRERQSFPIRFRLGNDEPAGGLIAVGHTYTAE